MNRKYLLSTSLLAAGFLMSACGGGGGGGGTTLPPLTPADAAKAGTFAAVDNPVSPTVGLFATIAVNAANTGFDVTGKAVGSLGESWALAGTMTRDGVVQITGTGVAEVGGVPPEVPKPAAPANMTVTGTLGANQKIVATVTVGTPVAVTFEKAVALVNPALVARFTLATDPGVTTAADIQHAAASLTVKADGKMTGALLQSGVAAIVPVPPAGLAGTAGARFAKIEGVVTNDGTIIGIGGGTAATGEALTTRNPLTFPSGSSGVIFTGTVDPGGLTATVRVKAPLVVGLWPLTQLAMVKSVNPRAGVFVGSHQGDPIGGTSTCVIGVNEDSTAIGYQKLLTPPALGDPTPRPLAVNPLVGLVNAGGAFAPNLVAIPVIPGVGSPQLTSGLVGLGDEGDPALVPNTFTGTITTFTNPTSGVVTTLAEGTWMTIDPIDVPPAVEQGAFTTTMLP